MENKKYKFEHYKLAVFIILLAIGLLVLLVGRDNFALFNSKGIIAAKERNLMLTAVSLMLIVVVPVYAAAFFIAYKFRADNKKAKFTPDWNSNKKLEIIWWAIPTSIILILASMTWRSAHELDPFRSIKSDNPPITIQVVALRWKWLFIYPDQNIATVNFIEFPEKTPVHFELTSDAPMNSFWIPQLGGQMYAMAGMQTQLNLMADGEGIYNGSAAEINGKGFSGMKFLAKSTSSDDFATWTAKMKEISSPLTLGSYNALSEPSEDNPPAYYSTVEDGLYHSIMMKYMIATP
jgi:cytochrome o ubiquinol oxidase subunit 2